MTTALHSAFFLSHILFILFVYSLLMFHPFRPYLSILFFNIQLDVVHCFAVYTPPIHTHRSLICIPHFRDARTSHSLTFLRITPTTHHFLSNAVVIMMSSA